MESTRDKPQATTWPVLKEPSLGGVGARSTLELNDVEDEIQPPAKARFLSFGKVRRARNRDKQSRCPPAQNR